MIISRLIYVVYVVAVLGLAACASQPAYRPADGADDFGYFNHALGDDRYVVGYNGNSTMSENLVKDYALFHAAELTKEQGKHWFRVVERESRAVEKRGPAPMRHETGYVVQRSCGLLGCSSSVRPVMQTTAGIDAASGRTIWSSRLEIVMGTGPQPTDGGSVYDADALLRQLMAKM
jgi:hypothetical protein